MRQAVAQTRDFRDAAGAAVATGGAGQVAQGFGEAGRRIKLLGAGGRRAQRVGERVAAAQATQQVGETAQVLAGLGEALQRGGRADFTGTGFRAQLRQAIAHTGNFRYAAAVAATGQAGQTAAQGFAQARRRVQLLGRGGGRAYGFGQRVAAAQAAEHVLDVAQVLAGFGQTLDRGGRADFTGTGFRAQLAQQLLTAGKFRGAAVTAGQTFQGFHEAGRRIQTFLGRHRAQGVGQRVAAFQTTVGETAEQTFQITEAAAQLEQAVERRGGTDFLTRGHRADAFQSHAGAGNLRGATAGCGGQLTGRFGEAGRRVKAFRRGGGRAQGFGERVAATEAAEQVFETAEAAAGFRQTVDRGGRADFGFQGLRADAGQRVGQLIQTGYVRRAAVATVTAAGQTGQITQTGQAGHAATAHGFLETHHRVHAAGAGFQRTNGVGERVRVGDHVDNGDVDTAGFVETVQRGLRADTGTGAFRAELVQELVGTGHAAAAVTATGQAGQTAVGAAGHFREAGGRVKGRLGGRHRAQLLGDRVAAADQLLQAVQVGGRFLQTGDRERQRAVGQESGRIIEAFRERRRVERPFQIERGRRGGTELSDHVGGIRRAAFGFFAFLDAKNRIKRRAGGPFRGLRAEFFGKGVGLVHDRRHFFRQVTG